jgi:hypothetical protein
MLIIGFGVNEVLLSTLVFTCETDGDAVRRTPRVIDQGIISTQERPIMIKRTIAALCSWP